MSNNSSRRARIGIIGAGIGASHVRGYTDVPQAEVAAICDLNTERALSVAQEHGLQVPVYADFRAMLDRTPLDAVSVCLPNALHESVAVACLDAGLHVLCEKPLAINATAAQSIAAAAARNHKQCMVGQVLRFRPDSLALKAASAALGSPYYVRAGSLRMRGIPGYGGWFTTKAQSGGGALIDMGVHLLDLSWWLAGCPRPVAATGVTFAEFGSKGRGLGTHGTQTPNGTFDVEDLAVALIRFENGLSINIEISWALNTDAPRNWCHVFSAEGGLLWDDTTTIVRDENDSPVIEQLVLSPRSGWRQEMWAAQCAHFTDSVLNNTQSDPDVAQGVMIMKMLDAIYQSAREGREVRIDVDCI